MADTPDAEVPVSPCMGMCQIDPETGWCRGCRRTLDEIAGWPTYSAAERLSVLTHIAEHRASTEDRN